jgi:molecular chaperone DnaJ
MDLYAVLDLTSAATPADIERAYLRLARRYHPGINPGDRLGAVRFRQVQEAYEILGDPGRRQHYDQGGQKDAATGAVIAFEGFDFSVTAQGNDAATFSELFSDVFQDAARRALDQNRGTSIDLTMQVSFEEAMRGGTIPVSVVRQERCPGCGGAGVVAVAPVVCGSCEGQGVTKWARGHMMFTKPCEPCGGTGQLTRMACRSCAGSGVQMRSEVVTVSLPAGVDSQTRLVVPGRGHAGLHGGSAGDLYVTIDVTPHPIFRREGRDLHVTVPVAIHEAALGARIEVPTLTGPVKARVPPGTAGGTRLRVRGHGVPSDKEPGDLIVEIQLVLPPVEDERSKALLREFGRLNPVDVRAHLFEQ